MADRPPAKLADEASSFYIRIPSRYLSSPYRLDSGDRLQAKITEVIKGTVAYPALEGKELTLILYPALGDDCLFLSREEWEEEFLRRGSLATPGFMLALEIEKAIRKAGDEEVGLYVKEDLEL